jgi:hypothetical protein
MRHEITVTGMVRVTVADVVDLHAVIAFLRTLADDPAFRHGMPQLVDVRNVPEPMPIEDIEQVAYAFERMRDRFGGSRAAILVSTTAMFGAVRQFGTLAERAGIEVAPFGDEREAIDWLGIPRGPASSPDA